MGNDYPRGKQIEFVLGQFEGEERDHFPDVCEQGAEIIRSFCLMGIDRAMNIYNTHKGRKQG